MSGPWTIEKQSKYGHDVWVNVPMDIMRKEQCLCLCCNEMEICSTAKHLYDICIDSNLAIMVTRCQYWEKKE